MKAKDESYLEIIEDEAKKIIVNNGLKSLSMDSLAKASSLSKATLYKIIQSKENLIEKIAYDFLIETRIGVLNSLLDEKSSLCDEDFTFKLAKLSIGNYRVLQKQIFKDYPFIRKKLLVHWDEALILLNDKVLSLQKAGIVKDNIEAKILIEGFKVIFDYYCLSDLNDNEIIHRIQSMYNMLLEGVINKINDKIEEK